MNTSDSIKAFDKWAADLGLNIETESVTTADGTIIYGYVDHGAGMACQGWLGREELLEDHAALLKKILEIVTDDKRWTEPQLTAFNRGTIIGMCHRAGIGVGDVSPPEGEE